MKRSFYGFPAAVVAVIANLFLMPLAQAQVTGKAFPTPPILLPQGPLQQTGDVVNLFCSTIDWIFWLLIVLSVIMFLVGGYRYVTAAGESEKVSKANKTLLYAAIAVVVALVAAGVPTLVSSFIYGGYGGGACGPFGAL